MMNLEKMKQKKRSKGSLKKGLLAATTIFCLTSPLLQMQSVFAAENTTPVISIEKPDGWKQGETTVSISVDASHMPEGFPWLRSRQRLARMEAGRMYRKLEDISN